MPKFLNDSGLSHLIDKIKSLFKRTHQEIGINIWDEEWRVGMYDIDNGKFVSNSLQRVASTNFISIIPSEKYWATYTVVGINLYFYDKNKAFISALTNLSSTQFPITSPSNAYYMTFDLHGSYGTVYKNDTCINVSDSDINGTYYPYRGLRKQITEVSNEALDIKMLGWSVPKECPIQNYMDADRKFHQRVGRIDLGTCNWTYDSTHVRFILGQIPSPRKAGFYNLFCSKYKTSALAYMDADRTYGIISGSPNNSAIFVRDNNYTTAPTFKTAMSGVYLYYELATEIVTSIDGNEATLPQGADDASGLNLTSSVGTISNIHFVRIGKLVNIQLMLALTSAITGGTELISGFPIPPTNNVAVLAIDDSATKNLLLTVNTSGVVKSGEAILSNHLIRINTTYITQ